MRFFSFSSCPHPATISEQKRTLSSVQLDQLIAFFNVPVSEEDTEQLLKMQCLQAAYEVCKNGEWNKIDQVGSLLDLLQDEQGETLLTLAIKAYEERIVEQLLEKRIALYRKDKEGNTPLHIAAYYNVSALLPLLQTHFSLEIRNIHGETPVHIAIRNAQEEVLNQFMYKIDISKHTTKERGNLLHSAIKCGQFRMVDYLLSKHYKTIEPLIEEKDCEGRTPLSFAAYQGETAAIYYLVKYGANLEAEDERGWRAIHWACQGKQIESIDCLASFNAKLNPFNHDRLRPEDLLSRRGDLASQQALNHLLSLIEFGIDYKSNRPFDAPPKNLSFKGGGPKGIAYIPALEELEKRKTLASLERIVGTSAGAIQATLMALGYTSKQMKEELDKQPLVAFLDYSPELESQIGPRDKIQEHISSIQSEIEQIRSQGISKFNIVKGLWTYFYKKWTLSSKEKAALKESWEEGGLCEGESFRKWIEAQIESATGQKYCTFGELAEMVKKEKTLRNGGKAKHLHLFATQIGSDPKPIHLSSEKLDWMGPEAHILKWEDMKDVIISDTVRLSISIPIAYKPHIIHKKDANGVRYPCPQFGYFVDGGLLQNCPTDAFDFKHYKGQLTPEENPKEPWFNPHTWGFSLYSSERKKEKTGSQTIFDVLTSCGKLLAQAEETLKYNEKSLGRVIDIDNQGIGLLEFKVPSDKEAKLFKESRAATQSFLRKYSKGQIGWLSVYYDYGLFKKKEAEGTLSLSLPHPDFIGREQERLEIQQDLLESNIDWHIVARVKAIVAPPGYGKSELAFAFACNQLEKFSYIWQIDLRNKESIERSYRRLAQSFKVDIHISDGDRYLTLEELFPKINEKLESHLESRPWLLIFDNADEKFTLPLPAKGGCILITSRKEEYVRQQNPCLLKAFDRKDAIEFIKNIVDVQEFEANRLACFLQDIPLLINQAAHYIAKTPNCTIDQYCALLSEKLSQNPCPKSNENNQPLIHASWQISLQRLNEVEPEAACWIIFCSYLDNKNIPKEWIWEWLRQRHPQDTGLKNYERKEKILKILKDYALIYSQPYDETFSFHGFFQEIIRKNQANHSKNIQELICSLVEFSSVKNYNPTHPQATVSFKQVLPHCISSLSYVSNDDPSSVVTLLTLTIVRYFIDTEKNLAKAKHYLEWVEKLTASFQHPSQGRIVFYKGLVSSKEASLESRTEEKVKLYTQALNCFEVARTIYEAYPDSALYVNLEQNSIKCNHEYQKAICLEYQAQTLSHLGLLDRAEHNLQRALKEYKSLYPSGKHFDIARIFREEGILMMKKGNFPEAIRRIQAALILQRDPQVYGERFNSHSTVAATYRALGNAYLATDERSNWLKADDSYREAIEINTRAYQTKYHPYNASFYRKRVQVLEKLGKNELAREMKRKAEEIEVELKKVEKHD